MDEDVTPIAHRSRPPYGTVEGYGMGPGMRDPDTAWGRE